MDAVDAAAAVGVSEAAAPENAIIEVKKKTISSAAVLQMKVTRAR